MAIVVVCPTCRNQMHAPESLAGQVRNCLQCQSPVKILASAVVPSATTQPELVLQAITAEQWFVTLPNRQVIGPASLEQYQAAVQRGAIPPQAMVQRADWPRAMSQGEIQARQQPAAAQAAYTQPQENPTPHGSYWQQLARNPLSTTLFGANVPDFVRGYRPPEVLAERARIFRWCWLIPLAILAAGIIFPLVASIPAAFRFGPHVLVMAPVMMGYAFAWIFWAPIIYLVGTYLFAGALFEWEILFNTKQVRNSRAAGSSIEAIRKFYMWFGGIAMGIGGTPPVLAVLVVTCYCLLAAVVPSPQGGPLASNAPRPAAVPGAQPARPLQPPAGLAVAPSAKPVTSPANPNVAASPNARVETVDGVTTIHPGLEGVRISGGPGSYYFSSLPNKAWEEYTPEEQVEWSKFAIERRERLTQRLQTIEKTFQSVQSYSEAVKLNPNDLSRRRGLQQKHDELVRDVESYRSSVDFWGKFAARIKPLPQGPPVDLSQPPDLPREVSDYLAKTKDEPSFPVDEITKLENQFANELDAFRKHLAMVRFGRGEQKSQAIFGSPPTRQEGRADELIELQLQELQRKMTKLREYQTEWNYASQYLEQKPALEQQLAEARQNKPPAFAGPAGAVGPPGSGVPRLHPAPNPPSPPLQPRATSASYDTMRMLERACRDAVTQYQVHKNQTRFQMQALSRPGVDKVPSLVASMEARLKDLQAQQEQYRQKMLEAHSKMAEYSRKTGEPCDLLDEPLPE